MAIINTISYVFVNGLPAAALAGIVLHTLVMVQLAGGRLSRQEWRLLVKAGSGPETMSPPDFWKRLSEIIHHVATTETNT